MLSLRRIKNIWYYDINLKGKRCRGTTSTTNKSTALLVAQKVYDQVYNDTYGVKNLDVLITDFVEMHMRRREKNLVKRYADGKRKVLSDFVAFCQNHKAVCLNDISLALLEEYKTSLLGTNSPKTVKNKMAIISTLLNDAVKYDYLDRNQCKKLDPIRGITKNKKRFLSKEEILKALDVTRKTSLETLVLTALYTGMRRAELINLKYEDIDLEKRLIYVKHRDGFTTKSKKERVIPLHANLAKIYQQCAKEDGFCFPISIHWATEYFTGLMEKIGLHGVGLHTLRHTFASHHAMAGTSLWEIAQWLGHSSVYVTELYSHLCPGGERREIDRVSF